MRVGDRTAPPLVPENWRSLPDFKHHGTIYQDHLGWAIFECFGYCCNTDLTDFTFCNLPYRVQSNTRHILKKYRKFVTSEFPHETRVWGIMHEFGWMKICRAFPPHSFEIASEELRQEALREYFMMKL